MAQQGHIFEATRENFGTLVLENSRKGLVVVDFWSPRAGPSLRQRDILTRLARELGGRFLLVSVDTDTQKALTADYGVQVIPSLRLFRHGRVVDEVRGMQPEADYRPLVERHLTGPGDRVQVAALRAWQAGERDKAVQILAQGAMDEPENLKLPLLMAKLLMQDGRHRDAHAVLAALPPQARDEPEVGQLAAHLDFLVAAADAPERADLERELAERPGDCGLRYALAARLLVADDLEGAMGQLLEILRREPGFRLGAARRGLLAIFTMLPAGDERARRFRAELSNLNH